MAQTVMYCPVCGGITKRGERAKGTYCGGCGYDPNEKEAAQPVEAVKHDSGKPQLSLLPPIPLYRVTRVLEKGAEKYKRNNWKNGMAYTRTLDAALRHIFAYLDKEDLDPESGENHLAHAICELLFCLHYAETGTGTDDR